MTQEPRQLFRPIGEREIWHTLVSEPGIGVGVVAEDGLILFVNEQAAKMYHQTEPENMIDRRLDEVFPKEWADERMRLIRQVIESGDPMTIRAIWNGRQIRSTLRSIEASDGEPGTKRVLIISRLGSPGTPETGEVVETEIVHLGHLDVLTSKEIEVLALLGQGLRLKEIAATLHRSPKTIDNHRTSIGRKLKLADRVDLAQVAADAGLQVRDAQRKRIASVGASHH